MSVINYNYASMQAHIDDSNKMIQHLQQACEDIDAGVAQMADIHVGETREAVLAKNRPASQRRQELVAQCAALNNQACQKMAETQQLDHQGHNALLA
jgi:uncharacterized protein YukE